MFLLLKSVDGCSLCYWFPCPKSVGHKSERGGKAAPHPGGWLRSLCLEGLKSESITTLVQNRDRWKHRFTTTNVSQALSPWESAFGVSGLVLSSLGVLVTVGSSAELKDDKTNAKHRLVET